MLKYFFLFVTSLSINSCATVFLEHFVQGENFQNLSFSLTDSFFSQSAKQFELTIQIIFGDNFSLEEVPLLLYCPSNVPSNMSLFMQRDNLISQTLMPNPDCYFDSYNYFKKSKIQLFTLSSYLFYQDLQQQMRKFPLIGDYINLGVYAANSAIPYINYEVNVQLNYRNQSGGCQRDCQNSGDCTLEYNLCKCDINKIGADCSIDIQSQKIPAEGNIFLAGYEHQPFLLSLRNFNIQQLNEDLIFKMKVSGVSSLFTYQCYLLQPLMPQLEETEKYIALGQELNDVLLYNQSDILKCQEFAVRTSSLLKIQISPYILLDFYNPTSIESQIYLQVKGINSGQEAVYLTTAYIVLIVLASMIFIIIVLFCIKARCYQPLQHQQQLQNRARVNIIYKAKEQERKTQAYNKFMPIKFYQEIIFEYSELIAVTECVVCLNEFGAEEKCRRTICFHLFHQKCLDEWLLRNETCPSCRQLLNIQALEEAAILLAEQQAHHQNDAKIGEASEILTINSQNKLKREKSLEQNSYIVRMRNQNSNSKNLSSWSESSSQRQIATPKARTSKENKPIIQKSNSNHQMIPKYPRKKRKQSLRSQVEQDPLEQLQLDEIPIGAIKSERDNSNVNLNNLLSEENCGKQKEEPDSQFCDQVDANKRRSSDSKNIGSQMKEEQRIPEIQALSVNRQKVSAFEIKEEEQIAQIQMLTFERKVSNVQSSMNDDECQPAIFSGGQKRLINEMVSSDLKIKETMCRPEFASQIKFGKPLNCSIEPDTKKGKYFSSAREEGNQQMIRLIAEPQPQPNMMKPPLPGGNEKRRMDYSSKSKSVIEQICRPRVDSRPRDILDQFQASK